MRSTFLSLSLLICLTGCGSEETPEVPVCTASIEPAISIEVRDASTNAQISCGAQALIEKAGYQETIENPTGPNCYDGIMLQGAYERPGVYTVTVTKPGYSPWSIDNVIVTSNICHVNTVTLQAAMQPL
jgi:hypothetical protein